MIQAGGSHLQQCLRVRGMRGQLEWQHHPHWVRLIGGKGLQREDIVGEG